ncbi:class I SAM-dependent methyltransferase [Candidatus Microgenomates bacterium]|nr:MAG: class I SAM-dependent methyltransferase [Candidatus Microgenomates bacterium]
MVWPPDSPWAPWWRTTNIKARVGLKLAEVTKDDLVYDLGCGDGRVVILAAKEFGAKGVGVEIDPLRFFLANFLVRKNKVSKKVKITRGNFFEQDLSKATVVFLYLVPKALKKLKQKLLKELKPNCRIVTYKYKIDLPLVKNLKEDNLYLYKLPKS